MGTVMTSPSVVVPRIRVTLWLLAIVGCRASSSTPAAEPEPEPAPVSAVAEPTTAAAVEPAAATVAKAEPPAPEPEPEPLVAPDGTVIEPCGEVPEGMACIPGGPFIRGSDDGPDNARPAQTIWLQTFYMDLNEVTYEDYKACQATKQCLRGGPLYNDFSRPKQPIVGPSWFAAVRYCEVGGKHLPTESQWEKAARGPDGAAYPWGDEEATCELAVIKDERGRSCGVDKKFEHPKKGRTFEIGTRPPGAYGLYDMAGNAWEWVYDWASPSWEACGKACQGTDPKGPCGGEGTDTCGKVNKRAVKGGSWYWEASYATGYHRRFHYPANLNSIEFHHFGFRCAASLEEGRKLVEARKAAKADPAPAEAAKTDGDGSP